MDIVTTSLDALLQRATNPQNENVDTAAVEAFCALVNKENEGSHIAVRLLANRIHAQNEKEALQALGVLDSCMKKCGTPFTSEIGKFRFLNEMIKLVSPKYLGSQTAPLVRVKVLQLLQCWTEDFPRETKIKEAYDMLKKQGVVVEVSSAQKVADSAANSIPKTSNSIFDNDERSRLLQKLLQSKNPDDLQAANRLIKAMVKEDDKRAELVSRRVLELESVHNNVRLLNEMLDSYRPGQSSSDELDLIKELHQSCERLRLNVYRSASEVQQTEEILKEVLHVSDEINEVFDKYTDIIEKGVPFRKVSEAESLLDLGSPNTSHTSLLLDSEHLTTKPTEPAEPKLHSDIDALCDIFTSTTIPPPISLLDTTMLKPTTLQQTPLQGTTIAEPEKTNSKLKALEDLDVLGETLLKENLSAVSSKAIPSFNKNNERIPMNLLPKPDSPPINTNKTESSNNALSSLDLSFLTGEISKKSESSQNGDDCMVDITTDTDSKLCISTSNHTETPIDINTKEDKVPDIAVSCTKVEIKPLTDINVTLESIKPSEIPPLTVLDEKNGISVTLHFAKDKPRDDVQVVVVTTISKNSMSLSSYLFQGVVPKTCKLKLQPPSGSDLPAHNPFLPPSAITQIMLIANPSRAKVSLKFMISYTMDEELCTEMGEVDSLPSV